MALNILRQAHAQDLLRAQLAAARETAAQALDEELKAALAEPLPPFDLRPMSRSTIRRILTEADLKPHRSTYGLPQKFCHTTSEI